MHRFTVVFFVVFAYWSTMCDPAKIKKKRSLAQVVCFIDHGCFRRDGVFYHITKRPLSLLPADPTNLKTRYMLYTKNSPNTHTLIDRKDAGSLRHIEVTKDIKIIIHGFTGDHTNSWLSVIRQAFFQAGDYNVIVVDWSIGARIPYSQATANARVVGVDLGLLVNTITRELAYPIERVHLIGHSLGAHLAGYCGEYLEGKVGQITGLDPAGPYFEGLDNKVKLEYNDAKFVDIMHTDRDPLVLGGFGISEPIGHVDFYPNNGENQPGCTKNIITDLLNIGKTEGLGCSHMRAPFLFADTVTAPGKFKAFPCYSYDKFQSGSCLPMCSNVGCAQMGMHANSWKPATNRKVVMFLDTASTSPYNKYHFIFRVQLGTKNFPSTANGILHLTFQMADLSTKTISMSDKNIDIESGKSLSRLFSFKNNVGSISQIVATWTEGWKWIFWITTKISIERVELTRGTNEITSRYCGDQTGMTQGKTKAVLKVCT